MRRVLAVLLGSGTSPTSASHSCPFCPFPMWILLHFLLQEPQVPSSPHPFLTFPLTDHQRASPSPVARLKPGSPQDKMSNGAEGSREESASPRASQSCGCPLASQGLQVGAGDVGMERGRNEGAEGQEGVTPKNRFSEAGGAPF